MAEQTVIDLRRSIVLPGGSDAVADGRRDEPGHVLMDRAAPARSTFSTRPEGPGPGGATGSAGRRAVQVARRLGASHVIGAGRERRAARPRSRRLGDDRDRLSRAAAPPMSRGASARPPATSTSSSTTSGAQPTADATAAPIVPNRADRTPATTGRRRLGCRSSRGFRPRNRPPRLRSAEGPGLGGPGTSWPGPQRWAPGSRRDPRSARAGSRSRTSRRPGKRPAAISASSSCPDPRAGLRLAGVTRTRNESFVIRRLVLPGQHQSSDHEPGRPGGETHE